MRAWLAAVMAALAGCGPGFAQLFAPRDPVDLAAAGEPFVAELAAGSLHTCARLRDGTVRCWGMGTRGQLGDGTGASHDRPVEVAGIDDAVQIAAEGDRTCAVRRDGSVWCWGQAGSAALDDGRSEARALPAWIPAWRDVRQLALAPDHDCAVLEDGRVACRGRGFYGVQEDGDLLAAGAVAVGHLGPAVEVAVGHGFSCARTTAGAVLCWGWNDHGQCGDAWERDHLVPSAVPGIAGARALVAGLDHACVLLSDGTASCWGGDTFGQRGDGEATGGPPAPVLGLHGATALWAGQYRSAAVLGDGTARGWGREWGGSRPLWPDCEAPREYVVEAPDGSLRRAPPEPYCPTPAPVPLAGVRQVVVGLLHACARTDDGRALCWGSNAYGGLGDGAAGDRELPAPVAW